MHDTLQKEIALYEKRTPKSAEAHKKAEKRIPLGVASNYRAYDPYPSLWRKGMAAKYRHRRQRIYRPQPVLWNVDGRAHASRNREGNQGYRRPRHNLGMPHGMEAELAEEICARYPVEMVRFGSSGTEATMHAVRIARAATGRDILLRFEGGYHGLHDSALVSVKPKERRVRRYQCAEFRSRRPWRDQIGARQRYRRHLQQPGQRRKSLQAISGKIAAIILEPIMMNVGVCMPQPGFLEGLREICTKNGALLIFDEVKRARSLVGAAPANILVLSQT